MRIVRPDGTTVHPGDTFTYKVDNTEWTYKEQASPPDPDRDPPFVGRIVMTDPNGDDQLVYPNQFWLSYKDDA